MTRHDIHELLRQRAGVAALEFALVAPVFLLLVMGMLNIGQMAYGVAVLNGAVQDAARSTTLKNADTAAADKSVTDAVNPVLPGVKVTSTRKSYYDFADIDRPEKFTDTDSNGLCNGGESYVDENADGIWNADIGKSGNGGANDVVVYSVVATYKPAFTMPFAPRNWASVSLGASAVKKNQPFDKQARYASTARTCQ